MTNPNSPRMLTEILPSPKEQVESRRRQGPRILTGEKGRIEDQGATDLMEEGEEDQSA